MKTFYYYGTDLNHAGHYFWELRDDSLRSTPVKFGDTIPFNPEDYPKSVKNGLYLSLGTVQYYSIQEWSVLAIEGSCSDTRRGSKSVFFSKDYSILRLGFDGFLQAIKDIPIANKIINQMPFELIV